MNLLDHLENRLLLDNQKPDFFDRHKKVMDFVVLMKKLQDILQNTCEEHGTEYLEGFGCIVKVDPSPGFSDYGERARNLDPHCTIEHITMYFSVRDSRDKWREYKSIQAIIPVCLAEKFLILGLP